MAEIGNRHYPVTLTHLKKLYRQTEGKEWTSTPKTSLDGRDYFQLVCQMTVWADQEKAAKERLEPYQLSGQKSHSYTDEEIHPLDLDDEEEESKSPYIDDPYTLRSHN
ncbi:MAG: hypothetical protein ACP5N3_04225 [Candidatus Nanoarchaeia archaeon]